MNLDRRLLRCMRTVASGPFFAQLSGGVASTLMALVQAALLARGIALIFREHAPVERLLPILAVFTAVTLARFALNAAAAAAGAATAARVKQYLRSRVTAQLARLGPDYTARERSGGFAALQTHGIEALDAYVGQYLPQIPLTLLQPLLVWIFVLAQDRWTALIFGATAPLIPFFMALIGMKARQRTDQQWSLLHRMSAHFLDVLQGLPTLKRLGRARAETETIARVSEDFRHATNAVLRVAFLSSFALELLATLGTALAAVTIGVRMLKGGMAFEPGLMLLMLAPEFYAPLRTLGARFHAGLEGASAAQRIFELLERPLPVEETLPGAGMSGPVAGKNPSCMPPRIEFRAVCFSYNPGAPAALDGCSLTLEAGRITALAGKSGAGKSTAAHVLLLFSAPQSGQVLVDGTDIRRFAVEDWRMRLAWVPQRPHLFRGTLAENLRIARPDATEVMLEEAAAQAGLSDFIRSLPRGFHTPIGERGARISGGQAQRLALARAFLKDAPLLILDEPTSFLDARHEESIRRQIALLAKNRTVLIIAHRLHTLREADHIVLLDRGRVIESGSPRALADAGGAWSALNAAYAGAAS